MRIVCVGAGPAGAALSMLLARNGIEVVLIERERDAARVFRGEALMPCGLDALHQMGLRDRLSDIPTTLIEGWEIFLDRVPVINIREPAEELGDLALRAVSQPALLELLVGEARQHPGFEFRPGLSVRGLVSDADGRVRGVRVSGPDGESEIAGDLVVGTDGRASTVRNRAGLPLDRLPESYDILWLKVAAPKELEGRTPIQIYASGPEAALAYISWDGRWQIAWLLPKGDWSEVRERDWLSECAALMPASLGEHLLEQRDAVEGPSLLDVVVGRCPHWHAPGLLLLGDAAHPMSPVRAQGINMALRDAIVAANHLVPAIREGGPVDAALVAIQREREREIVPVQKLQILEVRGQRWARQRPWLMAPMLKLAPLIGRVPQMDRIWLRQQRPLRFGVTEVRLRV